MTKYSVSSIKNIQKIQKDVKRFMGPRNRHRLKIQYDRIYRTSSTLPPPRPSWIRNVPNNQFQNSAPEIIPKVMAEVTGTERETMINGPFPHSHDQATTPSL